MTAGNVRMYPTLGLNVMGGNEESRVGFWRNALGPVGTDGTVVEDDG